jgi:hypothetical protein
MSVERGEPWRSAPLEERIDGVKPRGDRRDALGLSRDSASSRR